MSAGSALRRTSGRQVGRPGLKLRPRALISRGEIRHCMLFAGTGQEATMASMDKEAALVLNSLPEDGASVSWLATTTEMNPATVQAAVQRLVDLALVTNDGQTIRMTSFAMKARGVFEIVGR